MMIFSFLHSSRKAWVHGLCITLLFTSVGIALLLVLDDATINTMTYSPIAILIRLCVYFWVGVKAKPHQRKVLMIFATLNEALCMIRTLGGTV